MEPSAQLIGARSIALRLWITFRVAVCVGCAGDGPPGGSAGAGGGGSGGSGGSGGGSALATPELTVESGGIKTLRFSWGAVEGATSYRLECAPDGPPSFVQAGEGRDPSVTQIALEVPVHLIDWAEARYRVAACEQLGCSNSEPVGISEHMLEVIGYIKASDSGVEDRFGKRVAISADGNTIITGAWFEDSNGDPDDDSLRDSGAAYVFRRDEGTWAEEAYLKATRRATSRASEPCISIELWLKGMVRLI